MVENFDNTKLKLKSYFEKYFQRELSVEELKEISYNLTLFAKAKSEFMTILKEESIE